MSAETVSHTDRENVRVQTDIVNLISESIQVSKAGKEFKSICPFHDDQKPSLTICPQKQIFKCFSCGAVGDVFEWVMKFQKKTFPEALEILRNRAGVGPPLKLVTAKERRVYATLEEMNSSIRNRVKTFIYTNPDTKREDLIVHRVEEPGKGKRFLQGQRTDAGYVLEGPSGPRPIYNRSRVRGAERVVFVEGEGKVHCLNDLGIVATTTPGGAKNSIHADLSPLAGKTVVIWGDADDAGREYVEQVTKSLEALAPPVRILKVDQFSIGLPEKGDVVDYREMLEQEGRTNEEIRDAVESIIEAAEPTGPAGEVMDVVRAAAAGEIDSINWPWPSIDGMTQALLPGSVTVICGSPGSTKSLATLTLAAYLQQSGIPFSLYMLEDTREYHLRRALAQRTGVAGMTNLKWMNANGQQALSLAGDHSAWLDTFGRNVFVAPETAPTLVEIADWLEDRATKGSRVIIIDPITVAQASPKPWIDDQIFIGRAKSIMRRTGCSVVLIAHPRKGAGKLMSLDDIGGGASYQKLSHTVMWLEAMDAPEPRSIMTSYGTVEHDVNRVMWVKKARNGIGRGFQLGMFFDKETLRLREVGVIVERP